MIASQAVAASHDRAATLDQDGFVVLPGVFPAAQMAAYRQPLADIFASPADASFGDTDVYRADVISRYPVLADLFFSDALLTRLRPLLGEDFAILPETSITDSQYGDWHTDTTSAELAGWTFRKDEQFRVVNVAIYFQENGRYGGGLDVVPGSHLQPDVFLEAIRHKNDAFEKSAASRSVKAKLSKIANAVLPESVLAARRKRRENSALPLKATSAQPGQITIAQRATDVLVFDLRLSHKASWAEVSPPFPADSRKFAYFVICGANNETTRKYREFLVQRSQREAAYAYLRNHSYPDWLVAKSAAAGVQLL